MHIKFLKNTAKRWQLQEQFCFWFFFLKTKTNCAFINVFLWRLLQVMSYQQNQANNLQLSFWFPDVPVYARVSSYLYKYLVSDQTTK